MCVALKSPALLSILRSTLEKMDNDPEIPRDHPAAIEFRRSLLRSIAELEGRRVARGVEAGA